MSRDMTAHTGSDRRSGGRPRDRVARENILAATLRLLETQSIQAVTIEAIAKAAGVSKATIYRWWPSKASVVIDSVIEHHIIVTPMRKDLPPPEALSEHLRSLIAVYSGRGGTLIAQIIAEGQHDPAVMREFRERFYYGRRAVVREVLEEWRRSGDLTLNIELEMLADILYSPIYFRLLLGHAPLVPDFLETYPTKIFEVLGVDLPPAPREAAAAPARRRSMTRRNGKAAAPSNGG